MLLYTVTITIDPDTHQDWLHWMRETHIPEVIATNMFISSRLCRMLDHGNGASEIYAVQYLVQDMARLRRYMDEFAPALQRQHRQRYEGKFTAVRTVMEVLNEFGV